MTLAEVYKRWRHSKGFGVHSPFAFRFVTDILQRPRYGYGYYESTELQQLLCKAPRHVRSSVAMLFRLACRFDFKHIYLDPEIPETLERALHLGCKSALYRLIIPRSVREQSLVVLRGSEAAKCADVFQKSGTIIVVVGLSAVSGLKERIIRWMPGGWTFEGVRLGIFVVGTNELSRLQVMFA